VPGLDPGIHAFLSICQDVDGRDKLGHDDAERMLPALQGPSKDLWREVDL